MAASRPGNRERGWNDPPMFFYSAQTSAQKSPSRSPLHKRVAHPGLSAPQPSGGASASSSPLLQPPPSQTSLLVPPLVNTPAQTEPADSSQTTPADSSQTTPSVCCIHGVNLSNLDLTNEKDLNDHVTVTLGKVMEDCSKSVPKRVMDDVKKKVQIMTDCWQKLSLPVKQRMAALATALNKRNCDAAHEIHLSLMVDYTSEVNLWMVGIKRLIAEARKVPSSASEHESSDKTAENGANEKIPDSNPIDDSNTVSMTTASSNTSESLGINSCEDGSSQGDSDKKNTKENTLETESKTNELSENESEYDKEKNDSKEKSVESLDGEKEKTEAAPSSSE